MSETWFQTLTALRNSPKSCGNVPLALEPSPPDTRDWQFAKFTSTASALPRKFSRRAEMPPVRNQQQFGTCAAHAGWAAKSWQARQKGTEPAGGLSPLFLYSLSRQIAGIKDSAGTTLRAIMQTLQKSGDCAENDFPYYLLTNDINPPMPSASVINKATAFEISNYAAICLTTDQSRVGAVDMIKRAILEQGPVLIGIVVCENFTSITGPDYIIPLPQGKILGAHGMVLCGWDDDKGAFEDMNSWGCEWGDQGYGWLLYDWVTAKYDNLWWPFMEAWTSLDLPYQLKSAKEIILWLNDNHAYVDGNNETMDQPPIFIDNTNRTMIPLRWVAEHLGYIVNWQERTKTIELRRPN